ncbi:hypothetical protein DL93DRAFT_2125980 [Clavulina sp. PMI_390]|nr:hypothetical protein DL93DRAFT_2125980 [Clavulina sp. PMI_390]
MLHLVPTIPVTEPGISYECDTCDQDITHTIRIKCAAPGCEEIDLCVSCFCQGKEVGDHKAWHEYRVVEQYSQPIFSEDWGADEELLLIDGLVANGLGNWTASAEHLGTRTPDEAERHYYETYVNSPNWPLPIMNKNFATSSDALFARRRTRIAGMRQAALELANAVSNPAVVLTSAPTNHEIGGFMPGRLDFDIEVENDAEEMVKDLEFGLVMDYGGADQPEPGPPPIPAESSGAGGADEEKKDGEAGGSGANGSGEDADSNDTTLEGTLPDPIETEESTALKIALLDIYYEKLDRRHEAKTFVFDRGMLEHKKHTSHEKEKKRSKEDKDIIAKHKPFAKLQTAEDFERFINGIMQENALRFRIRELQDYRRNGITSLADAEKWTKESPNRVPAPLNLANADSLHLLTAREQELCSQLRILPKPYLVVKETLVAEYARRGGNLKKRDARDLVKIDVNKTSRIWEYLESAGLLVAKGGAGSGPGAGSGSNGTPGVNGVIGNSNGPGPM